MMKLFELVDQFMTEATWKDLGLVKLCVLAAGLAAGLFVPKKARLPVLCAAGAAFLSALAPLAVKLFRMAEEKAGPGQCRYSFEGYGFAPEEPEK